MIKKGSIILAFCAMLFFSACQPPLRIDSFTVSPRNVCLQTVTTANWRTTGNSTEVSVDQIGSSLSSPLSYGTWGTGLDNPGDYIFTLVAMRDSNSVSDRRTVTAKNSDMLNRSGQVTCDGVTPRFLTFAISNDEYTDPSQSPFFKVDRITNRSSQPISVRHLSIMRDIDPGGSATASEFGSVQLTGEWTITTPLPPNPCRVDSTGGGPRRLRCLESR